MTFDYRGSKNGGATRNLVPVVINDSITVVPGQAVETYSVGYANSTTAAQPMAGIVHSIVRGNAGYLPEVTAEHTAGAANTSDKTTVTTAADNTTTKKYAAFIDFSEDSLYSAEVSGTVGTTVDSELRGARIDVDSANTTYTRLLETTATRTIGTPAQYYSHGTDPEDATRLIVSLGMSEQRSTLE